MSWDKEGWDLQVRKHSKQAKLLKHSADIQFSTLNFNSTEEEMNKYLELRNQYLRYVYQNRVVPGDILVQGNPVTC